MVPGLRINQVNQLMEESQGAMSLPRIMLQWPPRERAPWKWWKHFLSSWDRKKCRPLQTITFKNVKRNWKAIMATRFKFYSDIRFLKKLKFFFWFFEFMSFEYKCRVLKMMLHIMCWNLGWNTLNFKFCTIKMNPKNLHFVCSHICTLIVFIIHPTSYHCRYF